MSKGGKKGDNTNWQYQEWKGGHQQISYQHVF